LVLLAVTCQDFSAFRPAVGAPSHAANEGERRHEVLRHLTELYVARGKDVSPRMRSGLELAPASFLNAELKRQGAKWRVDVGGSDLEFVEIS
jgi:hypothetical protein